MSKSDENTVNCTACGSIHTHRLPDDGERKQYACLDCRKLFIPGFEQKEQSVDVTFRINFRSSDVPDIAEHLKTLIDWWEDGYYTCSGDTRRNLRNLMESAIHDRIEARYREIYANEMYEVTERSKSAKSIMEAKKEISSLAWLGIQVMLHSVKAVGDDGKDDRS